MPGIDVLGTGPAIVTNGPTGAGKAGFQRSADPPFQADRGRLTFRHNQRFLPEDDDHAFDELRLQLEVGYASDRNFIEEYYKRLFDTGMDQETLAYFIWQKDNQYANLWTEGNLQNWYTDTQWLPRADYYRLGDSFFNNMFSYFTSLGARLRHHPHRHHGEQPQPLRLSCPLTRSRIRRARFQPGGSTPTTSWTCRSTSATSSAWCLTCRARRWAGRTSWAAARWAIFRAARWAASGELREFAPSSPHTSMYPWVESDLWNVHGLNNKISLFTDSRVAWSNVKLNKHRRAGRPGRQHLRIRPALSGAHELHRRDLAVSLRSAALDPAPDALADHGNDRRASVDRYGAAGHSPAAADQARARSASGGSSIT